MRLRIDDLTMREIRTRRGLTQVYDLVLSDGQKYDAFVGSWNLDWKKGQQIEIDAAQIERRDKGSGRVYLTIRAPAERTNGASPGKNPDPVSGFQSDGAAPSSGHGLLDAAQILRTLVDDEHDLEIVIRVRRLPKATT